MGAPHGAPMIVVPECTPGPGGTLRCAPPAQCGGAAFGGAGASGCAPPPFCTASADGLYDCTPPEDCRGDRCGPAPVGAACERLLQGEAAQGAFVPCAAAPTQFCPPPPPGAPAGFDPCRPAAIVLRFCAEGEAQFPPDHPRGAPPACVPPPRVESGRYVPPAQVFAGACVPPPPGEWPPAQPAPEGRVYCPPMGFAPPPMNASDINAWREHMRAQLPPEMAAFMDRMHDGTGEGPTDVDAAASAFGLLARPQFDGRMVNGTFVETQVEDGLALRDFRVAGASFFANIRPHLAENATFAAAVGSAVVAAHANASLETHNVPSGLLAYRGHGDAPFLVDFETGGDGSNASIEVVPHATLPMHLVTQGEWTGVLVGNATLNGTMLQASVDASNPAFFMAIPPGTIEETTRLGIAEAVAEGRVFGEVTLIERNDTLAEDVTFYEDASTFGIDVTDVTPDYVSLDVTGEGEGASFVFTVDRETLTTPLSELVVEIDGDEIPECVAPDGEELGFMEHTDDVCYQVEATEAVIRVAVDVEHFSSHTVVIGVPPVEESGDAPSEEDAAAEEPTTSEEGGATTATPSSPAEPSASKGAPGIGAIGVVAAVSIGALFARRRRS